MKLIALTQGQFAKIDDEDFERVNQFKWYADFNQHTNSYYARRNGYDGKKRIGIKMHRIIIYAQKGQEVDHANGISLDNQKNNLRFCTSRQNAFNRKPRKNSISNLKGVSWYRKRGKWLASIRFKGKLIYLGVFKNKTEAAIVYDKKAKELFGDFAYTNF